MGNLGEVLEGEKFVRVVEDSSPESPREWENLGTMVCFSRSYSLGDRTDFISGEYSNFEDLRADIVENGGKYIAPLYLYDHSGLSIKIGSWAGVAPHASWDSYPVGFIYTTDKMISDLGVNPDSVQKFLEDEVKIYDKYLRGEVYGYQVVEKKICAHCGHNEEEVIDSCYGYYSEEDARNAGEELL